MGRLKTQMSEQPHDRLTKLCARMTEVLDEPGNEDVKAVVFLTDAEKGGAQTHGYEDSGGLDAMVDVFLHLAAVFEANGKSLQLMDENGHMILGGPNT